MIMSSNFHKLKISFLQFIDFQLIVNKLVIIIFFDASKTEIEVRETLI